MKTFIKFIMLLLLTLVMVSCKSTKTMESTIRIDSSSVATLKKVQLVTNNQAMVQNQYIVKRDSTYDETLVIMVADSTGRLHPRWVQHKKGRTTSQININKQEQEQKNNYTSKTTDYRGNKKNFESDEQKTEKTKPPISIELIIISVFLIGVIIACVLEKANKS